MDCELNRRELAILATVLNRCIGYDDPRAIRRFTPVNYSEAETEFSEADMDALAEKIAGWVLPT